ncbi:MAG TPA: hypothetical protein VHS28_03150, partial [Chloroflexota bacterium]|nr:hypothetical protein [Chloroflexota bacterium]
MSTLLSTLGISHEFVREGEIDGSEQLAGRIHLIIGEADGNLMDYLCREAAVVVLPEPDFKPSNVSDQPSAALTPTLSQREHPPLHL